MVGAIEQEALEDGGIAGDEAGSHARQVGALGQAVEHHATGEVAAPQFGAGGQQPGRRTGFVEIEFAVALVGGDHEVVAIGQGDEPFQRGHRQQGAGGIAGRTEEQQLAALPDLVRHAVEIGIETLVRQARQVVRLGAGQQGRAFVDLVEGLGLSTRPAWLRSTTAWVKENSASRVPVTGST